MDVNFSITVENSDDKITVIRKAMRCLLYESFNNNREPEETIDYSFIKLPFAKTLLKKKYASYAESSSTDITEKIKTLWSAVMNFTPYIKTFPNTLVDKNFKIHPAIIIQNIHNSLLDFDSNFSISNNYPSSICKSILDNKYKDNKSITTKNAEGVFTNWFTQFNMEPNNYVSLLRNHYQKELDFEYSIYYTTFMIFFYFVYHDIYSKNNCFDLLEYWKLSINDRKSFNPTKKDKKKFLVGLKWTTKGLDEIIEPSPPRSPGSDGGGGGIVSPSPIKVLPDRLTTLQYNIVIIRKINILAEKILQFSENRKKWFKSSQLDTDIIYHKKLEIEKQDINIQMEEFINQTFDDDVELEKQKLFSFYLYVFTNYDRHFVNMK
jgi:hypothetical protein